MIMHRYFTGANCQKVRTPAVLTGIFALLDKILNPYFVTVIGRVPPATLASLDSPPVGAIVVPVVVSVVATSRLLLSSSPQLASVVPVRSPLCLADEHQEDGEEEEGEEESHDEIRSPAIPLTYREILFDWLPYITQG